MVTVRVPGPMPLLVLVLPLPLPAETPDDVSLAPVPCAASGTARFPPVAHSSPGDLALHVRIGFGPPHLFDPAARLDLVFPDGDAARGASLAPVRGPRMTVVLDNDRAVPVTVSLGVYASN